MYMVGVEAEVKATGRAARTNQLTIGSVWLTLEWNNHSQVARFLQKPLILFSPFITLVTNVMQFLIPIYYDVAFNPIQRIQLKSVSKGISNVVVNTPTFDIGFLILTVKKSSYFPLVIKILFSNCWMLVTHKCVTFRSPYNNMDWHTKCRFTVHFIRNNLGWVHPTFNSIATRTWFKVNMRWGWLCSLVTTFQNSLIMPCDRWSMVDSLANVKSLWVQRVSQLILSYHQDTLPLCRIHHVS